MHQLFSAIRARIGYFFNRDNRFLFVAVIFRIHLVTSFSLLISPFFLKNVSAAPTGVEPVFLG